MQLRIPDFALVVLIGASGSGKSTLLRLINRLQEPTEGVIRLNGEDTGAMRPELLRRQMGYVIQGGGLFPHWTVARNTSRLVVRLK